MSTIVSETPLATRAERPSIVRPPMPPEQRPSGRGLLVSRVVTAALVVGPVIALAVLLPLLWGHLLNPRDIVIGAALYLLSGFGISVGYHRLFTHRSFKANRALKVFLAVAGSMAVEGSLIGWVAIHRRHHMFSDKQGDPHSPHRYGAGFLPVLRGFLYAHVEWLFAPNATSVQRFAPDLTGDRDLVLVDRLFPLLGIASLAAPFAIGWGFSGTLAGALTALLWAGLVRMAVLHHVTWSINSVCHLWGKRPFVTSDSSSNFAPLALLSFGESWHNFHHAQPSSARHGVLAHQLDPSARVIRLFEHAGWATKVHWPTPERIAACSRESA